jgi:SAM-dependent methyltransferase
MINDISQTNQKIAEHWSAITNQSKSQKQSKPIRWWQTPRIIRHINHKVCGIYLDGISSGLTWKAKQKFEDRIPFLNGVSVGCRNGRKEIELLRQELVQHFTLYELSEARVEQGYNIARQFQIEDRITFILGDAFQEVQGNEIFDLVHWNNSLHHMLDVDFALKWSLQVLKPGRLFYMDDYFGENRLQFSQETSEIASKIRSFLPKKYLKNPQQPNTFVPKEVYPPDVNRVKAKDPSEAPDSKRILPCIYKYFPNAEIIKTGGAIYSTALQDIISNFEANKDGFLLDILMLIDNLLADSKETQYAAVLAIK